MPANAATLSPRARLVLRKCAAFMLATNRPYPARLLVDVAAEAIEPLDRSTLDELHARGFALCRAGDVLARVKPEDFDIRQSDLDQAVLALCAEIERTIEAERALGFDRLGDAPALSARLA
jgi:ParB-like chromosome segregation protein Spo0J